MELGTKSPLPDGGGMIVSPAFAGLQGVRFCDEPGALPGLSFERQESLRVESPFSSTIVLFEHETTPWDFGGLKSGSLEGIRKSPPSCSIR